MDERHLRKARRLFGANAAIQKRPSGKFRDGQCSVCLTRGPCRRKWGYSIGRVVTAGPFPFFEVLGSGHSLKDAWSKAEEYGRGQYNG